MIVRAHHANIIAAREAEKYVLPRKKPNPLALCDLEGICLERDKKTGHLYLLPGCLNLWVKFYSAPNADILIAS